MSKPKVLVCAHPEYGLIWAKDEIVSLLGPIAELVPFTSKSREEFYADCKTKYDGVVGIYRHSDSALAIGVFDKDLIEHLPSSVKYVCHNGAGYDQVDVAACSARGIQVSHTPGAVDDATATNAAFLIISALRQFSYGEKMARSGLWKGPKWTPASDPEGRVLGIIGMGGIGKALARRMLGFNMKIIYYNRSPYSPAPDFPCTYIDNMNNLLAQSDVVSLNLPLNANTKGSFGKAQFDKMKDGACLVNTARGAVVVEEDLIAALESGKLACAGLDVYPEEPKINPILQKMDQITILPHLGTETRDTQKKMEVQVVYNLISALTGKGLINLVKEQRV
ncbi:hypothetical protein TREMEDRAFT_72115 [Tremella mesenterica DSM 1558]|uniref:uncharacterized protein n=1 Tax=Tremella mesenterica (strain ATCC 24925 / CBS 8224 / DSM 1558 / NBRC 9311 / NRRL Y-6157 / RJB 2259-6 / UBC 559-6) TaxID=578456 RepID=UPI0003F490CE|nr:uncharacterized protein TREMEDRAFT_72115 [Tremella mesenterica DSM 1558]EIW68119.1 hypothetical protein TREMEDRAFT_72115 [Tremella mesenterica DSM 1558]